MMKLLYQDQIMMGYWNAEQETNNVFYRTKIKFGIKQEIKVLLKMIIFIIMEELVKIIR